MTKKETWRVISPEELEIATYITLHSGVPDAERLSRELEGAEVAHEADWVLDIRVSSMEVGVPMMDGPLPIRTFVPNREYYQGEIIIWTTNGHISGLEYAWISDEPPTCWPSINGLEISSVE